MELLTKDPFAPIWICGHKGVQVFSGQTAKDLACRWVLSTQLLLRFRLAADRWQEFGGDGFRRVSPRRVVLS